jgi:hypothetical protein
MGNRASGPRLRGDWRGLQPSGVGEFCGESADAHLQDLAWLGPRVCRHEAVIEEVMRQAPCCRRVSRPCSLPWTACERFVLEHREAIAGFFANSATSGSGPSRGCSIAPRRSQGRAASAGPRRMSGRRPLPPERDISRRSGSRPVGTGFQPPAERILPAGGGGAGEHAGGFRERKVLAPVPAGTDAEVVLNWAFLVSPAALDEFPGVWRGSMAARRSPV